jgi:hypothetical protein
VAQPFTAAIKALFSSAALAAEVKLRQGKYFFRKLLKAVPQRVDKDAGFSP